MYLQPMQCTVGGSSPFMVTLEQKANFEQIALLNCFFDKLNFNQNNKHKVYVCTSISHIGSKIGTKIGSKLCVFKSHLALVLKISDWNFIQQSFLSTNCTIDEKKIL